MVCSAESCKPSFRMLLFTLLLVAYLFRCPGYIWRPLARCWYARKASMECFCWLAHCCQSDSYAMGQPDIAECLVLLWSCLELNSSAISRPPHPLFLPPDRFHSSLLPTNMELGFQKFHSCYCVLFVVPCASVIDLGVMTPCEKILQTAIEHKAGKFFSCVFYLEWKLRP